MALSWMVPFSMVLSAGCCPWVIHVEDTAAIDPVPAAPAVTPEPPARRSLRPDLIVESLDNGLQVFMLEDHAAPLVSFQVWFRVGSVNEREAAEGEDHGITGLSHFFEHMMFRGTEAHPKFFDEIYSLGGTLNAFTWLDETVYWEKAPSQHLESLISMEADRLEHMKIDFLSLEPEREVVKSERLLRTENSAEGMAWELLQARMFEVFPYHWKTIGWMRDLNAITVQEAQDYHSVFYAPNNAYIIVAGDHDPAQTLAWIKQHYGHLPAKSLPSEDFPPEPPQTAERRDRTFKAIDPQVMMWGYRAPAVRDRDYAVIEVLDRVLNGGKSSRLQQRLVHTEAPKLGRLYSYLMPMRHPYMYIWGANLQPGVTSGEIETAVDAELARVLSDGVTDAELARAVAGLRSDLVRQNLSNNDKAEFIGFSLRATDSPYTFIDRLETYGEITVEDIQRVAGQVMRKENRTVVQVVNPARLAALADAMAATEGIAPQAAGALKSGVAILLQRQELETAKAAIDAETDAITRLEARAVTAREGADPATVTAIDDYLATNEKGATKRRTLLARQQAEYDAGMTDVTTRFDAFASEVAGLDRQRWNPGAVPNVFAIALAKAMVAARTGRRVSLETPDGPAAQQAAYRASLAWILEDAGLAAQAAGQRAAALDAATQAMSADSADTLAQAAHALAWDTRRVGVSLADAPKVAAPPEEPPKRKRRKAKKRKSKKKKKRTPTKRGR